MTSDGASTNRRLMKIHDTSNDLVYKVKNPYSTDGRDFFFFSDPPHLLKTTRNCWSSKCRSLWVSMQAIGVPVCNLRRCYHVLSCAE